MFGQFWVIFCSLNSIVFMVNVIRDLYIGVGQIGGLSWVQQIMLQFLIGMFCFSILCGQLQVYSQLGRNYYFGCVVVFIIFQLLLLEKWQFSWLILQVMIRAGVIVFKICIMGIFFCFRYKVIKRKLKISFLQIVSLLLDSKVFIGLASRAGIFLIIVNILVFIILEIVVIMVILLIWLWG